MDGRAELRLIANHEEARCLRAHEQGLGAANIFGVLADARIYCNGAAIHAPGGQVVRQGDGDSGFAVFVGDDSPIPVGRVGEIAAHVGNAKFVVAFAAASTRAHAFAKCELLFEFDIVIFDAVQQRHGGAYAE